LLTNCFFSVIKIIIIGGVLGYFYQKEFEKAGLNVEYVATDEQNLKKLLAGRIDIFPVAGITGVVFDKQSVFK